MLHHTSKKSEMSLAQLKRLLKKEFAKDDFNDRQVDGSLWKEIALRYYEKIATPRAMTCFMLLAADEYLQLVSLVCSPSQYNLSNLTTCYDGGHWPNKHDFADDYGAISLLKKYQGFIIPDMDLAKSAKKKASLCEAQCQETNRRFARISPSWRVTECLLAARDFISRVLGSCPSVESLVDDGHEPSFGPGSSSSCNGLHVNIYTKLQASSEVTQDARPYAAILYALRPRLNPSFVDTFVFIESPTPEVEFDIVRGNRFTTVPKSATTLRPICIEPHVNIVLQKMVGSCISRRLKHHGLDISLQQNRNRDLAKRASMFDDLATIDLASASDTISTQLVRNLLPPDWFDLLNNLRSHETGYDGKDQGEIEWHKNHKFSSMGNGFTFELETLIFWAIAKAAAPSGSIAVSYGDDIILPNDKETIATLLETFQYCGLTVNHEKSFITGPFKESCGHDYVDGLNIRPFFIKEEIQRVSQVKSTLNGIRHYATRRSCGIFADARLRSVWRFIVGKLSSHEQVFGPASLGDDVIWGCSTESPVGVSPVVDNGIVYCLSVSVQPMKVGCSRARILTGALMSTAPTTWVKTLYGSRLLHMPEPGSPRQLTQRGDTGKVKVTSTVVSIKNDSVPWL